MENSSVQLGDWSGYGQRGNAGNLRHLLGLMSKEVAAMRRTLSRYFPRGPIALMADTGDLRARGGRRRKLFGRALRVCRPRLRHSADGSIGYKSRVDVDDGSTGGNRLEALSRPRTAGCSETSDRGGQS